MMLAAAKINDDSILHLNHGLDDKIMDQSDYPKTWVLTKRQNQEQTLTVRSRITNKKQTKNNQ